MDLSSLMYEGIDGMKLGLDTDQQLAFVKREFQVLYNLWMMNCKGCGKMWSWPGEDTILAFALNNIGKPQQP
jgi:hypothetical protein